MLKQAKYFITANFLIGIIVLFLAVPLHAFAASVEFMASARVVEPLTISKTADLSFGSFAPSASSAGTIYLLASGSYTVSNITVVRGEAPSPAKFVVSGQAFQTFTITLPGATTLNSANGAMPVSFTTDNPVQTLDATGKKTIALGGQLQIAARQDPGLYTSSLVVTVDY